jgi:hypothetical protein
MWISFFLTHSIFEFFFLWWWRIEWIRLAYVHPSPDENKIIINIYKLIESSRWRRRRLVWLLLIGAAELLVIKGIGTKPWVILLRNITHSYSWNVTPVRITPHSLSTCVCVSRFLFITSKDFLSEGNIFLVFRSRSGGLPHENDSPFWCRGDGKFFSKGSRQRSMTSSLVLKKKKKFGSTLWLYFIQEKEEDPNFSSSYS